ncbi:collagen alpha-6(VI) chain-like [Mytilus trossulus]|uniref:collagen alpha-6(VI) chain-like n=1 Tax=Mytilus trossulus TaxID=6551 RepID=UPI003003C88B
MDDKTDYAYSLKFDRKSTNQLLFLSDDNTVMANSFSEETPNFVNHLEQFNTYKGTIGDKRLTNTSSGVENCIACSDIVFLIDESGSINDAEFLKMKTFIKSVVQLFPNVGPNGAQFGAVSFSGEDDQTLEFDLKDHGNATSVLAAIDTFVNNGTDTHIGAALEYVENNLFNVDVDNGAGRPCAVDNRFAIVITDGKTVGGTVPKAQSLKNANVKILSVGVGDGVDISLLQAIASGNQNVFLVEDFDTFPSILDGLISSICTQDSTLHGFCGFPCTLHNKTYDLCPCDENNVNQTYSVGGNDTTVFTENFGDENKTDWECYTRSGRFYVVR